MVFSELYSAYYQAVAEILKTAFQPGVTEQELRRCVETQAFSESALTILPALKSGKWPLLWEDLSPVLHHVPTMPLTLLEKRWLKAISQDPRVKLFGVTFPELEGVSPLFTQEDYRIYDQYHDGDPFEDETYIQHFRLFLTAIREERSVALTMRNKYGKEIRLRMRPKGLEYSVKDDKIRILAEDCRFRWFKLSKVLSCQFCEERPYRGKSSEAEKQKELTLCITDGRNALERAMMHFAHFEKQAERVADNRYILRLKYYENDEVEMVIRVLSFGPSIQVLEPESFVELIRERLEKQRALGLK